MTNPHHEEVLCELPEMHGNLLDHRPFICIHCGAEMALTEKRLCPTRFNSFTTKIHKEAESHAYRRAVEEILNEVESRKEGNEHTDFNVALNIISAVLKSKLPDSSLSPDNKKEV